MAHSTSPEPLPIPIQDNDVDHLIANTPLCSDFIEKVPNEYRLDCNEDSSVALTHYYELGWDEANAASVACPSTCSLQEVNVLIPRKVGDQRKEQEGYMWQHDEAISSHATAKMTDEYCLECREKAIDVLVDFYQPGQHGDIPNYLLDGEVNGVAIIGKPPFEFRLDCHEEESNNVLTHFFDLNSDDVTTTTVMCLESSLVQLKEDQLGLDATRGSWSETFPTQTDSTSVSAEVCSEQQRFDDDHDYQGDHEASCVQFRGRMLGEYRWSCREDHHDILTHAYDFDNVKTSSTCMVSSSSSANLSDFSPRGSSVCSSPFDDTEKCSEASFWGEVFVTRIQTWFKRRAKRRRQTARELGDTAADQEEETSLYDDMDQFASDGLPETFEERVRTRAYYLHLHNGSHDEKTNYYAALKMELELLHARSLQQ